MASENNVEIKGLAKFQAKLKKVGNPAVYFDRTTAGVAALTMNALIKKTPVDSLSGLEHTRNFWEAPGKLHDSVYSISNTKTSKDKKHSIAAILNYGRKEVRPKKLGGRLYIPLSRKAKNRDKALGAPIPKDFKFGIDFVLARKSKAYKGTGFVDAVIKKSERVLSMAMARKLRKDFD